MQETIFSTDQPRFSWIDVAQPSPEELDALATKYGLHATSVHDCLEPEHLPKHEQIEGVTFLIVRGFDDTASPNAETTQQLSRKIAIFLKDDVLITIHRTEQRFLEAVKVRVAREAGQHAIPAGVILYTLLDAILATYWKPLEAAEQAIGRFEGDLFSGVNLAATLREIYRIKRRVTVIRWMGRHTLEVIQKQRGPGMMEGPGHQDLKEHAESVYFAGGELLEDATNLLNMQLALASHRTNEVMRVLTIFSVFFMPLTFIVGVYGMNFDFMPELQLRYGYALVWLAMLATSVGVWLWFRRQKWL